jgi:hypothetical protein
MAGVEELAYPGYLGALLTILPPAKRTKAITIGAAFADSA